MHNFRRLVARWEYHVKNFLGFVHLACIHIMLRRLSGHFSRGHLMKGKIKYVKLRADDAVSIDIFPFHFQGAELARA
jgi:hypothetical protein